jgi:hypothetical protein
MIYTKYFYSEKILLGFYCHSGADNLCEGIQVLMHCTPLRVASHCSVLQFTKFLARRAAGVLTRSHSGDPSRPKTTMKPIRDFASRRGPRAQCACHRCQTVVCRAGREGQCKVTDNSQTLVVDFLIKSGNDCSKRIGSCP